MSARARHVDRLARAAPRTVGVDAARVGAFLDDIEAAGLELHSLMIWRDGAVVAEGWRWPYAPGRLRMTHSMTKSVTASAIGLLIGEGRLSLGDRVASFFPEVALPADAPAAALTVEDLLTMRTGHAEEVSGAVWRGIATSWVAEFFAIPAVHPPGTVHVYTSAASYMLSAIVTRITGELLADYLRPRLFEPLGIDHYTWDVGPDGINPGGNGLSLTTADCLKLGILEILGGMWGGRRVLPADWVALARQPHGAPDYGYHWVVGDGYHAALGIFVQMLLIYPESGAVVMINAAMEESKVLMPHLKRHFPAAFMATGDGAADAALAARLASWQAVPALRSEARGDPATVAGDWTFPDNATGLTGLGLRFSDDGALNLTMRDADGDHAIVAPRDAWREAPASLPGAALHHGYPMAGMPVVAGYRWTGAERIELVLHFAEAAFRDTLVIERHGDVLTLDRRVNINSGPRAWPTLTGRRA